MNYRHAFHAGNFADLVKHVALLTLLARMTAEAGPLTVIDTHAGRGLYDLAGPEAKKSGEADAGIVRLMAAKGCAGRVRAADGGGAEAEHRRGGPALSRLSVADRRGATAR